MILCSDVVPEEKLISTIENLNNDETVGGIILQLPLPESINKQKVLNSISVEKDIDALGDFAWEKIESGEDCIYPATATGIITMLDYYNITLKDKKVTVVGRSKLVGKPIAILLEKRGAIVTVCHSKTTNTKEETKSADIIVSATGVPKLITKEYVSTGQVIIDVGINEGLVGDVDYEEVSKIVDYITPVPGGIGPMTIISIFENFAKLVGK